MDMTSQCAQLNRQETDSVREQAYREKLAKFIILSYSTFAVNTCDFLNIIGEIDSHVC